MESLLSVVFGMAVFTKEKAEELTNHLVEKGEMQREEARKLVDKLVEKGYSEKDVFVKKFQESYETMKNKLVTKEDLVNLEKRISELEEIIKKTE